MHRFGRVHGEGHPGRENAAHHRQRQPFLEVELFSTNAHSPFFQQARVADDHHADQRNKHAHKRHATTGGAEQKFEAAL
ncbi:hypothetical protein D3C76_1346920 [compost metagenome]